MRIVDIITTSGTAASCPGPNRMFHPGLCHLRRARLPGRGVLHGGLLPRDDAAGDDAPDRGDGLFRRHAGPARRRAVHRRQALLRRGRRQDHARRRADGRRLGVPVGKMSGRGLSFSGGTLDKLESIPGFNVHLTIDQFKRQLHEVGVVVAGQTHELARLMASCTRCGT